MAKSDTDHHLAEKYANRSWSEQFSPNHEFSYSSGASCLFHFLLILALGLLLTEPSSQDRGAVEVEMISVAPEPNPGEPEEAAGGGDPGADVVRDEVVRDESVETEDLDEAEDVEIKVDTTVTTEIAEAPTVSASDVQAPSAASEAISQLTVKQPASTGGPSVDSVAIGGGGGGASTEELIGALNAAGVGTGDIGFSLLWNGSNDLDLHIVTPSGQRIFFRQPRSSDNGVLDRDANAGGRTDSQPIENIFWPEGTAPEGTYRIEVHYYAPHGSPLPTPFRVLVRITKDGETTTKKYSNTHTSPGSFVTVATINYTRD